MTSWSSRAHAMASWGPTGAPQPRRASDAPLMLSGARTVIMAPIGATTDIPHEIFKILEDGHVYCEGIVFYALPGEEWEEYDCM